jgi:chlorobenzene dioxygenase small subunit/benzene/toluene dioxygenase beta subunit
MPVNSQQTAAPILPAASADELHAISQFLYHEAELLDAQRIAEWIELMADDLTYVMPISENRGPRDRQRQWSAPDELAYFDEGKEHLRLRLRKLESGAAWAEEPQSRTRHLITNVRARRRADGDFEVRSNFLTYRNRSERQADFLVGERIDGLRSTGRGEGFEIYQRRILLDQSTYLANNLSFFL